MAAAVVAQSTIRAAPADFALDKLCEDSFLDDELLNSFIDDNDFFFPAEELDFIDGNTPVTNDPNDANDHASRYRPSKRVMDVDAFSTPAPQVSPWTGRDINSPLTVQQTKTTPVVATTPLPSINTLISGARPVAPTLPSALPSLNMAGLLKEGDRLKATWMAQAAASRSHLNDSSQSSPPGGKRKLDALQYSACDFEETKRQRNRDQARSTRRRRKQYVDELQVQADRLAEQQQRLVAEGTDLEEISRRADAQAAQKGTIKAFFDMRAAGNTDRAKWENILDNEVEFIMPLTPFRSTTPHEVKGSTKVIRGVDGVIADTASLAEMFVSSSSKKNRDRQLKPGQRKLKSIEFSMPGELVILAGKSGMGQWSAKIKNFSANVQCELEGMVKFILSPENKILHLELICDMKGFMQQLDALMGKPIKVAAVRNPSPTSVAETPPVKIPMLRC